MKSCQYNMIYLLKINKKIIHLKKNTLEIAVEIIYKHTLLLIGKIKKKYISLHHIYIYSQS